MSISTLGEAIDARWRVFVSCCECSRRAELDGCTLLWRSGRAMPMTLLAERLRCVQCGCREVRVTWSVPATPTPKDKITDRYTVEQLDLRGHVVEEFRRDRFDAAMALLRDLAERKPGARFLARDGSRIIGQWPERST